MHKTLNKVLLVILFIAVGAYFLQNRINSPAACEKVAGVWNTTEEVCDASTEQVIYQSLSKPNPISLLYPDSERFVELDKTEQVGEIIYLRGHYETLLQAATDNNEAVYDRGSIYLNMSEMEMLTTNTTGITYFAAPFIINTAGKGVFIYVGLFSYDFKTHQAKHLDSELLGNRVREESIVKKDDVINVDFKSHSAEQAYSDYPTQASEISLRLIDLNPNSDKKAHFELISGMHASWDINNDGVNDCERLNSCDDSVDYTQAKPE